MAGFSQEIIDRIIDYLAFDRRALYQSSLVCRAFYHRCKTHIHRVVDIGSRHSAADATKQRTEGAEIINRSVQKNPSLACYIHHLRLSFVWGIDEWPYKDAGFLGFMELAKKCGASGRTFKEVTIADPNTEVVDDGPEGYLEAFQAAFWRPYIASSITKLSFHHAIEVPVEIILECVHLVDLSSYFATLLPPSDSKGEVASVGRNTRKKIALKRLSLGTHSTRTFYDILFGLENEERALIDITKLETYGCAWHPFTDSELDDQDATERTLKIAAPSLRKLEFERVGRIDYPTRVINLATLSNIQALDFDYDWQHFRADTFENMCGIMSTAQRGHKLNRVDIHRIIHTDELIDTDCSLRSCREQWLALDKALVQLASTKSNEVEELVLSYEIIVCTKTRLDDAKFRNEKRIRSIVKTMEGEFLEHAMPLSKQSPSIRVQVTTSIEQYDAYAPRHRDVMHVE